VGVGELGSQTGPNTQNNPGISVNVGLSLDVVTWQSIKTVDLASVTMPTWRADYFDNPKDSAPSRSEIIVAENESDALHEARNKMGSLCSRAEVIPLEVTANPQSLAA
jgi:hypothetical protein